MTTTEGDPLEAIDHWPVPTAAAGWIDRGGRGGRRGPTDAVFELASVTKPLVAYAVLVAVEEGSLALDAPVTQPTQPPTDPDLAEVTLRQLLSHASGLNTDARSMIAEPQTRRIYSNAGFELIGDLLEQATGFTIAAYLHEAVLAPLEMRSTELRGSPAHRAVSTVEDLLRFCSELMAPTLLDSTTLAAATTPVFADLGGVLPGFGRHDPNPWGLGFEIRGEKSPHWTGSANAPATFGHFGRAGTMLWVDPVAGRAVVALTDRDFGRWAAEAWPALSNAVLGAA